MLSTENGTELFYTSSLGQAGQKGFVDGRDPECKFNEPTGVRVHEDGSIFVLDSYQSKLRRISTDFTSVSSLAYVVGLQYAKRLIFTPDYKNVIISCASDRFGIMANRLVEVPFTRACSRMQPNAACLMLTH